MRVVRVAGEQFDSTLNQYYLRARYYNQGVGRFTAMDTFQGINHDPRTLHKYLYTPSDPVNFTDPSGNIFAGLINFGTSLVRSTAAGAGAAAGSVFGRAIAATFIAGKTVTASLRREVATCRKTQGKKCRIPNLVVIGENHAEAKQHIADAIQGRGSNGVPVSPRVTYKKGGNGRNRQWYRNKPECKENVTAVSGKDCDECTAVP